MVRLAWRGILAHKVRFTLTTFAVVLGVGFVVGAFALTDSIRGGVDALLADVSAGVDGSVRREAAFGDDARDAVEPDVAQTVAAVDGVASAEGIVFRPGALVVGSDGEAVTTQGAPLFGVSWGEDDGLYPIRLAEGRKPVGPDEVVVDRATADDGDLTVGDLVTVLLPGETPTAEMTLVGTVTFGENDSLLGARLVVFDPPTAQRLMGLDDQFDQIDFRVEAGSDTDAVLARVQDALPDGVEVVTSEQTNDEIQGEFEGFIGVFQGILLGFAGVTLFVSAFLINNTFTIILGQRIRELALLRAVGASPTQVRRSVLGESLVIGAVATLAGLGAGLLIATGIRALLDAGGFGLPAGALELRARTLIAAVLVGIGVTMAASIWPAYRAGRVPPLAALREGLVRETGRRRGRIIAGTALGGLGGLLLANGLFAADETASVLSSIALGAILVFVGVAMLSPLVAEPVARGLAWPLVALGRRFPAWFGPPGRLARENSARNPHRTAATASALMIGLALVSMALVVGTTFKESFASTISQAVKADYVATTPTFSGFSHQFAVDLQDRPEIDVAAGFRAGQIQVDGDTKDMFATDRAALESIIDIDIRRGGLDRFTSGGIMIHEDPAADLGIEPGDTLTVTFPETGPADLVVSGIHADASFAGNWLISTETWNEHFTIDSDVAVMALAADGVDPAQSRAVVDDVATDYPQLTIEDRAEFQQSQEDQLNSILLTINVLVGLSVVIALIGIANTLALSVFERTREIGMLRAVGMSRRQARRMVRWEAVIIAVFGAVLGVVVGIPFGLAAVAAMPAEFVRVVTVPVGQIVALVVIAGLFGLLAAVFPARRAGRLDVLAAIAHE